MAKQLGFLFALIAVAFGTIAQQSVAQENDIPPVLLDFHAVETPLNFGAHDYTLPTMQQSLDASTDFYAVTHRALGGDWRHHRWRIWLVTGEDVLMNWFPLGSSWMHEEWHRAVMSNRGISSFN